MRHFFRLCFLALVGWVGYLVVRAVCRAIRRQMGLPVAEPSQEERLMRQAIVGTLGSSVVPLAYLNLSGRDGGLWLVLVTLPALAGAGVLWVSGVKGIFGLYRREPKLLGHPTVFITCVAASFAASMVAFAALDLLRQVLS